MGACPRWGGELSELSSAGVQRVKGKAAGPPDLLRGFLSSGQVLSTPTSKV